jgi:hypothetical protein
VMLRSLFLLAFRTLFHSPSHTLLHTLGKGLEAAVACHPPPEVACGHGYFRVQLPARYKKLPDGMTSIDHTEIIHAYAAARGMASDVADGDMEQVQDCRQDGLQHIAGFYLQPAKTTRNLRASVSTLKCTARELSRCCRSWFQLRNAAPQCLASSLSPEEVQSGLVRFGRSTLFQAVSSVAVMINALIIGLEADNEVSMALATELCKNGLGPAPAASRMLGFKVLEWMFIFWMLFELVLNVYADAYDKKHRCPEGTKAVPRNGGHRYQLV